jgi:superfamily II DNA/RNA helicase
VFKLHGSIVHAERKTTFSAFDQAISGVLFATDVASRGLDFKNVHWVVQFDLTGQLKEYANRIGRTARLNAYGNSICFISMDQEEKYLDYLKEFGCPQVTQKNWFQVLKEFSSKLQEMTKVIKGGRVFKAASMALESEDEKYEILLYVRLFL